MFEDSVPARNKSGYGINECCCLRFICAWKPLHPEMTDTEMQLIFVLKAEPNLVRQPRLDWQCNAQLNRIVWPFFHAK
jgi:hypothetical protein